MGRKWIVLVCFPVAVLLPIWLGDTEAWLHPEQIRAAAYIWDDPTQSTGRRLRKAFDWAALDTANPVYWKEQEPAHRARPVGDILLVVDAVVRPYISTLYPHPSLTPSAIAAGLLAPVFFFAFVRLVTGSYLWASILTGLWISSMGFLSVIVPDIHSGAKRTSLMLLCACLYLGERHRRSADNKTFWLFAGLLFLSLFTDEMALGAYVAVAVVYLPQMKRWKAVTIALFPMLYLAVVVYGLPAFYAVASNGMPPFSPLGGKKVGIFKYLLDANFYVVALTQTSRAILTTFGIISQSRIFEVAVLLVLAAGTAIAVLRGWPRQYAIVASAVALVANGVYLTLLDQYPGSADYLASYGYYRHSSLGLLALVWLAFTSTVSRVTWRYATQSVLALYFVVAASNFYHFHTVNQLVALAHMYPYQPRTLYKHIRVADEQFSIKADCYESADRFNKVIARVDEPSGFREAQQILWLSKEDVTFLLTAHYPWRHFSVATDEDGCLQARVRKP